MADNRKPVEVNPGEVIHWMITAALMWKVFGWQYGAVMLAPLAVVVILAVIVFVLYGKRV